MPNKPQLRILGKPPAPPKPKVLSDETFAFCLSSCKRAGWYVEIHHLHNLGWFCTVKWQFDDRWPKEKLLDYQQWLCGIGKDDESPVEAFRKAYRTIAVGSKLWNEKNPPKPNAKTKIELVK